MIGCDLFLSSMRWGPCPGPACEYTRQAAVALKAAHDKGVVHGDVSPHTLLLTPATRGWQQRRRVHPPAARATIKLVELGLTRAGRRSAK